jgi:hypothetical protein
MLKHTVIFTVFIAFYCCFASELTSPPPHLESRPIHIAENYALAQVSTFDYALVILPRNGDNSYSISATHIKKLGWNDNYILIEEQAALLNLDNCTRA